MLGRAIKNYYIRKGCVDIGHLRRSQLLCPVFDFSHLFLFLPLKFSLLL